MSIESRNNCNVIWCFKTGNNIQHLLVNFLTHNRCSVDLICTWITLSEKKNTHKSHNVYIYLFGSSKKKIIWENLMFASFLVLFCSIIIWLNKLFHILRGTKITKIKNQINGKCSKNDVTGGKKNKHHLYHKKSLTKGIFIRKKKMKNDVHSKIFVDSQIRIEFERKKKWMNNADLASKRKLCIAKILNKRKFLLIEVDVRKTLA